MSTLPPLSSPLRPSSDTAQLSLPQARLASQHSHPPTPTLTFSCPYFTPRSKLSAVSETLELWLAVQSMWVYMESVFSGGDIVTQLPAEAERFAAVDETFMKVTCAWVACVCVCVCVC